ncbi:MAG: zinc-ribbon domain-containing protein, partial [Candidatus Lokiarchaeia archaeon]
MYCPECGIKLIKGSKFCHRCGARVEALPSESLGDKETIVTKKSKTKEVPAKSIGEKETLSPAISE